MKILKYRNLIIGAIAGGISGYAYYYFVGCASGTCAITSSPVNSSLYGVLLGSLLADILKKRHPEPDNEPGKQIK